MSSSSIPFLQLAANETTTVVDNLLADQKHQVLEIVVLSGFLDVLKIDRDIRCLSKEFQSIGSIAEEDHPNFKTGLWKTNHNFKFMWCRICKKMYHSDGTNNDDSRCICVLTELGGPGEIERKRRLHIRALADPRLDRSFPSLSIRAKAVRTTTFALVFSSKSFSVLGRSNWLYRMTMVPLFELGLAPQLKQWNEVGLGLLSTCMLIHTFYKACSSVENDCLLLDIAFEIFSNPSKVDEYLTLLDNDDECIMKWLSNDGQPVSLLKSFFDSLLLILKLHDDDLNNEYTLAEHFKYLGNSLGRFISNPEHMTLLGPCHLEYMYSQLPKTFVWMPMYGGSKEAYIPPVNEFASVVTSTPSENE